MLDAPARTLNDIRAHRWQQVHAELLLQHLKLQRDFEALLKEQGIMQRAILAAARREERGGGAEHEEAGEWEKEGGGTNYR